ncbi:hypothetical protein HK099_008049, partial [Clydaea vesicula]
MSKPVLQDLKKRYQNARNLNKDLTNLSIEVQQIPFYDGKELFIDEVSNSISRSNSFNQLNYQSDINFNLKKSNSLEKLLRDDRIRGERGFRTIIILTFLLFFDFLFDFFQPFAWFVMGTLNFEKMITIPGHVSVP